jgi:anionic cell wall polymer biosynthesis LytR-Cps2A-Psr (LCP) family protein
MIYARIRKIDGENFRALRQQKVLTCLFEKAKNLSITKYPGLLKSILQNVETSLSYSEIMDFAPLLAGGSLTLATTSVPGDEVIAEGGIFPDTHGSWVWKYDLEEATDYIRKWIYDID